MSEYTIRTKRLGLRNWKENDLTPSYKMCSDKQVMEFFPRCLTLAETQNFIDRMKDHFTTYGFCYFAVDRLDTNTFIGFIGLMKQSYHTPFSPFIDIGWRLLPEAWGNGYATEGALACLDYAFNELRLTEVYAVAPILNKKSRNVMHKIGMHECAHFEHPKIDSNDPLCRCVAYKLVNE